MKQSKCQRGQRCSVVLAVFASGYTTVSDCCVSAAKWRVSGIAALNNGQVKL